MNITEYPNPKQWAKLCQRPQLNLQELEGQVKEIMAEVELKGDDALKAFTERFDGVLLEDLQVKEEEFLEASISQALADAIQLAAQNIKRFHQSQQESPKVIETIEGVKCWRKSVPIEKVGLYIPGGTAPLFSSLLMLGIPAKLAGCQEIVICTPPQADGKIHPAILFTAQLIGIRKIVKAGGAQAIAALTYGTASVPQVDKIFGPGNQYVTMAKILAQQEGVAIDMPAGPSEVLVIADDACVPAFVAADLLSQAEHGADSQVIFLTDSMHVLERVMEELAQQLEQIPRKKIAQEALQHSQGILLSSIGEAIKFSNQYAPEHLIIATRKPEENAEKIVNAGSVFLGNYSCESAGDYASGTNHTLPTNGAARAYSGVSLDSFVKKITFQQLDAKGIQNLGAAIELMAEAEELIAHKQAVSIRLNALKNENAKVPNPVMDF